MPVEINVLFEEVKCLEKILDNTQRQILFLRREHRSIKGLGRLLQKRGQLLKQLAGIKAKTEERSIGNEEIMEQIKQKILQLREKIQISQQQLLQAAMCEKNNISAKLVSNKMTRNVRNAYIMRWYQGVSRGFSRQG